MQNYSFDGANCSNTNIELPTAKALREALHDLMLAQKKLDDAEKNVPDYTAQWDNADYTRNEAQTLIVASNAFEDALVASVQSRMTR